MLYLFIGLILPSLAFIAFLYSWGLNNRSNDIPEDVAAPTSAIQDSESHSKRFLHHSTENDSKRQKLNSGQEVISAENHPKIELSSSSHSEAVRLVNHDNDLSEDGHQDGLNSLAAATVEISSSLIVNSDRINSLSAVQNSLCESSEGKQVVKCLRSEDQQDGKCMLSKGSNESDFDPNEEGSSSAAVKVSQADNIDEQLDRINTGKKVIFDVTHHSHQFDVTRP